MGLCVGRIASAVDCPAVGVGRVACARAALRFLPTVRSGDIAARQRRLALGLSPPADRLGRLCRHETKRRGVAQQEWPQNFLPLGPDEYDTIPAVVCAVLCSGGTNRQTSPERSISQGRSRQTSSGRMPVSRWIRTIAETVSDRYGRIASTKASSTGLTGSFSGASVCWAPRRKPETVCSACQVDVGTSCSLAPHLNSRRIRSVSRLTWVRDKPAIDKLLAHRLQGQGAERGGQGPGHIAGMEFAAGGGDRAKLAAGDVIQAWRMLYGN